MNARADRFPLFDSLRAIAALSVLAFHAAYYSADGIFGATVFRQLTARLDVGVTIFFVISGFLLYRPFVRARLRGEPLPHPGAYGWRRFLRIAPAYWVALTVVALWLGMSYVFTASGIPTFYGFAQIYQPSEALRGIGQAWTLCVEVTFYAFLPLWALAMRAFPAGDPRRVVAIEVAGLVALFLASNAYKVWALTQVAPTALNSATYLMPLPNFLDQFALGMALAVASAWYEGRETLPRPLAALHRVPVVCWGVALAAFLAAGLAIGYNGEQLQQVSRSTFLARHELYSVVAVAIVFSALVARPGLGLVGRLLASRPLTYLGLISYGIYLYSVAVLQELEGVLVDVLPQSIPVRLLAYVPLGVAGAAVLASLSYYAVERPALRLKRLVGPRVVVEERGEAIAEPAPAAPSRPG